MAKFFNMNDEIKVMITKNYLAICCESDWMIHRF